jgi:AraC-like DNA-binding protein
MQPIWLIHWMSVGANPSLTEVAHATRSPEDATWLRRWNHRVWCLVYTFNTATRWRIGSTANPWRTRSANTLLLIPPGTPYWEDMLPDMHDPSEMAWVKFVGGDTAVRSLIPPGRRYAHFLDPERLAGSLLKEIVTICRERGQRGFWQAQSAFCLLLSRLQESEPVDGDEEATRRIGAPPAAAAPTGLVQRVNAYLPQCIAGPLKLADLARHLNVSVSLLSHRYREQTGETPRRHLLRLRLDQAKTMLVTGYALKEIADATGFVNAFNLSRTFKRLEGLSPRDYLRNEAHGNRVQDDRVQAGNAS